MLFQGADIDVAQRAADGGLARHTAMGGAEGRQQQRGLVACPLRNGGGGALITQQRTGDDTPQEGPFQAFALGFARVGLHLHAREHVAILRLVHRPPLLRLVMTKVW